MDFAQRSLTAKRYDSAIAGAQAVLMIDPGNLEAKKLLARAQYLQNRAKQRLAQTPSEPLPNETVAATTPVIPVTAVTKTPPAQPAATTASLHVHFVCDFPDGGVAIVYVNEKEKARLPVEASRGGFLGLRKSVQHGDAGKSVEDVPAGTVPIRVSVTPAGRKAIVKSMTGNFQGGVPRNLEIHLSADGQLGEPSLR
jgi:hypothetical protein